MSTPVRATTSLVTILLAVAACGADVSGAEDIVTPMPEPMPSHACATEGDDGTGTDTDDCDTDGTGEDPSGGSSDDGPVDACAGSEDCDGGFCVAPYDESRGAFACEFTCIPLLG
jgi:hypothetical protein